MENQPEEMATEILSRLPLESIVRCKFVCKAWYVLLTNPNFVAKHVAYQYLSSRNNLVFLKREFDLNRYAMCILSNDNIDDPETVELPCLNRPCDRDITLIGHCGGLIALCYGTVVVICNFTTREFRPLPYSSLGLFAFYLKFTYEDGDALVSRYVAANDIFGFGYDPRTKDYKIVRLVTYSCCTGRPNNTHGAEVFGIHTDSRWRQLNVNIDYSVHSTEELITREPYFNGSCYWRGVEDKTKQNLLISFHMADEIFSKTPMPALECFEDCTTKVSIGVYDNSIALYVHLHLKRIDVWVMKEVGAEKSWSKQLAIEPFTGLFHLGFWNGSEKEFLYTDFDGQLAIYDPVTKKSKSLYMRGWPCRWVSVPYMKTIVSVRSKEHIESTFKKLHL